MFKNPKVKPWQSSRLNGAGIRGRVRQSAGLTGTPMLPRHRQASPPKNSDSTSTPAGQPAACCVEGISKNVLLARADTADDRKKTSKKPNIVVIMGDDVGWFNIGACHRGIMSGKTPHLDKLASQGMLFTDYYAEASCTAGRANFITGQIPLRTGLTTVGQAGADIGMPAQACTLATALKSMGYATGQFGKNHLGDLNKYLPTVHGFDEFFGYLYHLDALSDPYWSSYPKDAAFLNKYGPRNLVHSYATDKDDETVMKRLGQGRQAADRGRGTLAALRKHGWPAELAGSARTGQVRHGNVRQGAGRAIEGFHGQGQEGRQTILPLAQHDPHARLDLPVQKIPGAHEPRQQLQSL